MNYLILGASGLVGSNCQKHCEQEGDTVYGTYFSFETPSTTYFNTLKLDDPKNLALDDLNLDWIIHCGALTHVDYCEDHVEESYSKTVQSTINAVELAKKYNCGIVYLSTDYVFDGKKGYYTETDEVNPLSVYGKHKLEAEQVVSALDKHLIVRITNVYGDEIRGKNFVSRLSANMQKGEPMALNLPYDQYATPANAWDIARAIRLLVNDDKRGIYHFGSVDYLNRVQLAQKVINFYGHDKVELTGIATSSMNQAADRPLKGGFDNSKFIAEYPSFRFHSVDEYLLSKKAGKTLD